MSYLTRKPHRPRISFTFDDGSIDQYTNMFPILKGEYGFNSTLFVITDRINTEGYLTNAHLIEMNQAGFEIGSHTKTNANMQGVSSAQQLVELSQSKAFIESLGIPCNTFAPPSNLWDLNLALMAEPYYSAIRTGYNGWDYNEYPLYRRMSGLGRSVSINSSTVTTQDVINYIDRGMTLGSWMVLVMHEVGTTLNNYTTTPTMLREICDYIASLDVDVMTFYQALFSTVDDLRKFRVSDLIT